jgi:hypothetical protein
MLALAAITGCATTTSNELAPANHPSTPENGKNAQGDMPQMKLPPGWTQVDMQACIAAATPGPMQQKLARGSGHWTGTSQMWMPGSKDAETGDCSSTVSMVMDGRFAKVEMSGVSMGMPFNGLGFYGYDNAQQKFVATWLDTESTGIMNGDGTVSNDGNTLTWNYHMMCPIQKKMTTMREVDHYTSDNNMTLDMYGDDPKTGKEFHMMHIEMTRASS